MSFERWSEWGNEPVGPSTDPEAVELDRDAQVIETIARILRAKKRGE